MLALTAYFNVLILVIMYIVHEELSLTLEVAGYNANYSEHASKMAAWQGSARHKVFLIDSKIAIFADDSKLYKIISKNTDKTSPQQDDSALQLESHLNKVHDPKHLQQKIAVKQIIPHRWDPTNHC